MTTALLEKDKRSIEFNFTGKGSELFSIQIVNFFLTVFTLGLYYPWARAKTMDYLYRKTELAGSPFTFHGTGKEMFIGFIKGVGVLAALYLVLFLAMQVDTPFMAVLFLFVYLVSFMVLVPVALHGMMRYRTSRSSWRGIHFGYRGELSEMVSTYMVGFFLTIITFGIYGPWFIVRIRKEMIENVRFGSAHLRYTGDGADLLLIHVKGYFLSIITLGIYLFWYVKDLIRFYTDNIVVVHDDTYSRLQCNVTGFGYLKLAVINLLLIVCTLGLGASWATARTMSFILNNSTLVGTFDPDTLVQTEEDYNNAMYEDLADVLDIGLV